MKGVYLYTKYQRFWHWFQMGLMLTLAFSGFIINDVLRIGDYYLSIRIHNIGGIVWITGFVLFWFWMATTGDIRQYRPTMKKLFSVIMHYSWGIFHGRPHPSPKTKKERHNPLQRLVYLGLMALLLPLQGITGLIYLSYGSLKGSWPAFLTLERVAMVHSAGAYAVIAFLIVHVYMTTTGETVTSHVKSMITGWEKGH